MDTSRTPLSKPAIAAAALHLIDRDGLDQLSMRRIGGELGYEAMALYKHVADKAALLDAVVEMAYDEMTRPDADAEWTSKLRQSADELRRAAQRHPALFTRMVTTPPATNAVLGRIDSILTALTESGLSDEAIVGHFHLFVNMTAGALLAEAASLEQATTGSLDTQAPPEECRALVEFGDALANCDFDTTFDRTVDSFIRLVRLQLDDDT